jgi:hypothetical protein
LLVQAIACSCFSQQEVQFETSTSFVNSSINDINLFIWDNVKKGKLTAYRNDSLASTITYDEIFEMSTLKVEAHEQNPDNPEDPYDLIIKHYTIEFNPDTDFKGISVSYQGVFQNWQSSFQVQAFAPIWKPVTESGIELGNQPYFWVKKDDLIDLLPNKQVQLFEALIMTRDRVGDFQNPWFYPYTNYVPLGDGIGSNATFNQPYYHLFSSFQDSIMGQHMTRVLTELLYPADQKRETFYKDVKCKKAFKYVQDELMDTVVVQVPDPDLPDDPYALIEKEFVVFYHFGMTEKIFVHGKRKKKVVEFRTESNRSIFIRLNELLKYANNDDKILVHAYLKSLD